MRTCFALQNGNAGLQDLGPHRAALGGGDTKVHRNSSPFRARRERVDAMQSCVRVSKEVLMFKIFSR